MRISDWSSEVCSSDLATHAVDHGLQLLPWDRVQLKEDHRINCTTVDQHAKIVAKHRDPQNIVEPDATGGTFQDKLFVVFEVELEHDILHRVQILWDIRNLHHLQQNVGVRGLELLHAFTSLGV